MLCLSGSVLHTESPRFTVYALGGGGIVFGVTVALVGLAAPTAGPPPSLRETIKFSSSLLYAGTVGILSKLPHLIGVLVAVIAWVRGTQILLTPHFGRTATNFVAIAPFLALMILVPLGAALATDGW